MKLLPLYTFLLGLLLCFFYLNHKKPDANKFFEKIDTIYSVRERFVRDTIKVKETKILNHFDTVEKTVTKIFEVGSDSQKIALFDSIYKRYDTSKFLNISQTQAKNAIEMKYLFQRDSALLGVCQENIKNCDNALTSVKNNVDSLKLVKPEGYFFRDFGIGFGTALGVFGLAYIVM